MFFLHGCHGISLQVDFIKQLVFKQCHKSAKMLSTNVFCPFDRGHYSNLYDTNRVKLSLRKISEIRKEVVGIKLWTAILSREARSNMGGLNHTTAFYSMAKEACPVTIQVMGSKSNFHM